MAFTPHPHARYVRRARKYPLHVRYNPRRDVPPYVPTYTPYVPEVGPGGGDQGGTPITIDELTEFDGLPSGYAYLTSDGSNFLTTPGGIYLIGVL